LTIILFANYIVLMLRQFIKNNTTLVAIVVFLFTFTLVVMTKPALLFNKDGSARKFGIGFKNKTVIPIWLVSIILGILAYFIVIYYIASPKLM
jgi:hypothetical protein